MSALHGFTATQQIADAAIESAAFLHKKSTGLIMTSVTAFSVPDGVL